MYKGKKEILETLGLRHTMKHALMKNNAFLGRVSWAVNIIKCPDIVIGLSV